jgi:predicted enzyme related to lactoylglutathione lyase
LSALAAAPLGAARPAFAQAPDGWPAIVASPGESMPGKWVWHELLSVDPDRAAAFYSTVFGWSIVRRGGGERAYRLARLDGRPVAGLLRIADGRDGRRPASRWIGLLSVADVDAAIDRVVADGGARLVAPTLQLGRGRVALVADPEGAPFGLIRSLDGDPPDAAPIAGDWAWRELWARDGARMAAWYRGLGGYVARRLSTRDDRDEWLLAHGEQPRAGVVARLDAVRSSAWLPYLRVAALGPSLAAVQAAGGRVLLEPSAQRRGGRTAIVEDPTGAPFGLVQPNGEGTP